jgi:ABC-type Mn2+/Zn2+ transport system permease subunit
VNTLVEMLSPDFLLREALMGSVLVGCLCPLVGVYFVLRRMIFLGVALPQLSAAGIALAFLVYRMFVGQHQHLVLGERWLALLGSLSCTLVGLLILAMLARYREMVEARIGVTYALAAAATLLLLAMDPAAEAHMVNLLKGDILATTGPSLTLMAGVFGAVGFVLLVFRKEFLLVSFDRDLAVVFGKSVGLWDSLLYLMIGMTISLGVMTAGPIVTFGFLVIPPLTARMITRHMLTFSLTAASLGATTAFAGFYCAYRFDLPPGPAEVALASLVLAMAAVTRGLSRVLCGRGMQQEIASSSGEQR